ncbi:MAG: peptidoglycan D,D-transpeptidase FtsI family protein [Gaiella sp.]
MASATRVQRDRLANRRIRLLGIAFTLVFVAAFARAVWMQGVNGTAYESLAQKQQIERIELPAGRGAILDRNAEPLAIGQQATTVYADPRAVVDKAAAAKAIDATLGLDANEVYGLLEDSKASFVYIQRKADPFKAAELEKLGIKGLGFYGEERRAYPQGRVGAHVIGFAGTDNEGLEGIERSFDSKLSGRPGFETIIRDPAGQTLDVIRSRAERPGTSVTLSLDHQIQSKTEHVLATAARRWGALGATAIVMDTRTGAILAMANAPVFNANKYAETRADIRRNRAVTDQYEPGSTFKIVTIAAALEEGVVQPSTSFVLKPTIQVADRVIREAHTRGTERLTVREILSQSSNVGTVTVAQELGSGELAAWIERFGFGKKTGLGFPGESAGSVLPLEKWYGSTIGTVPIGQGIAVTPMQMVLSYATIGNGGVMPQPRLVERVGGHRIKLAPGRRIVSQTTANRMMAMFRDVVVEGTGTGAAIPGYTVAGKTGTALKAENGVYVRKYVASFVGLVPAKRPRLAVLVMVDEPKGQIFGGEVAAPIFRDIARFTLQYLEVPPDVPQTREDALVAAGSQRGA